MSNNSSTPSETGSTSVPSVPERFQFGPAEEGEPTKKKCNDCGLTVHYWYLQTVLDGIDPNPVATANLHKRVVLCSGCGKVSVTK